MYIQITMAKRPSSFLEGKEPSEKQHKSIHLVEPGVRTCFGCKKTEIIDFADLSINVSWCRKCQPSQPTSQAMSYAQHTHLSYKIKIDDIVTYVLCQSVENANLAGYELCATHAFVLQNQNR